MAYVTFKVNIGKPAECRSVSQAVARLNSVELMQQQKATKYMPHVIFPLNIRRDHPLKTINHSIHLSDNTVEARLEPLDGLVALDAVAGTDAALGASSAGDALTRSGHAAVEVHAVDTDRGVVLDTKIDVLADTEAEVAGLGEVALAELVLLDLEATLENLLGLGASDGDVDSNLFVTSDTEGTDSVAGLAVDGGLTRKLLEHLGGTGKSVTRLADGNVQNELLNLELPHGVASLLGRHCCG